MTEQEIANARAEAAEAHTKEQIEAGEHLAIRARPMHIYELRHLFTFQKCRKT